MAISKTVESFSDDGDYSRAKSLLQHLKQEMVLMQKRTNTALSKVLTASERNPQEHDDNDTSSND